MQRLYTRKELINKLSRNGFSVYEVENIMSAIGTYTIGCVVVACQLIGLPLTGDKIDNLYFN